MNTKIQILKLENTLQNLMMFFLFFVLGNKGRSQIFIRDSSTFYVTENSQDASAFYMAENTNVILEKRVAPKLTTSKIYIVQGTATNINTDSNSEIIYLETRVRQKRIIPRTLFKKKIVQPKKIRYEKQDLVHNTFCKCLISLLFLKQKKLRFSRFSKRANNKKQGTVRYLVQLHSSVPNFTIIYCHRAITHYWNCKKETNKKVRPPPIQA